MSLADPILGTINQDIVDMGNVDRKKYVQKINLIKQLYENGASSILELFTKLGISHPTCQNLVAELIDLGLIEKKGKGTSVGGRKPDLYGLKDDSYYVVSIDMERFHVRAAIFDNNNNNVSGIRQLPLSISKDISVLNTIRDFIDALIRDSDIDTSKILGIGMSMPGLINSKEYINYTYLSEGDFNLKENLEQMFPYPVFIENDVKSATIAESRHGLAKDRKDALVVLLDWGIGLGIIMDGKIRKGAKGFSGEIGHMPFVDDGALCYCGKRGCLETVASGIALARMVKEGIKSGQHSLLNRLSGQEINEIEPHIVIEAANQGDQFAISMLSKLGNSLGKGIATLIQLFNPEVIILGGKIAEAKQYITIPIIQSINTYSMAKIREDTKVTLSELRRDASLTGNIYIVIDGILEAQMKKASS
ncbi:ROK family transcriptional regulator [Sphingobacterium micropteri]|nr:ROK family transcriptional regulator [Sphingobacterium micropteri]